MRNPEKVRELFKRFAGKNFPQKKQLFESQSDKNTALAEALEILGIDSNRLARIPHFLRERFLRYRLLRTEFEFHPCHYTAIEKPLAQNLLNLSEPAYDVVLHSDLLQQKNANYSKHSQGLFDLHVRSPYQSAGLTETELQQTIFFVAPKNSGIEPGFKGMQLEDLVFYLAGKLPEKKKRLDYIERFQADVKAIFAQVEQKRTRLKTISTQSEDKVVRQKAANELQELAEQVPSYLIKLDYKKDGSKKVRPDKEGLARTEAVKNLREKWAPLADIVVNLSQVVAGTSTVKVNANAVIEVLNNDYARIFGMRVQEQRILYSTYSDGKLKLMLKGKWLDGYSELGPLKGTEVQVEGGGIKAKKQGNYMVVNTPLSLGGIEYISDTGIENLAEYLPLLLVQGDYDAVGSKGQNKLRSKSQLVGIDFGHGLRQENDIIKTLDPSFAFESKTYKNFSVFYDSSRRVIVQGLLIFAKLKGVQLDGNILRAYGDDFYQRIQQIEKEADAKLFQDYENTFTQLRDAAPFYEQTEYQTIIKAISDAKTYANNARDALIARFKAYLTMPPALIDFIENLEKLHACIQRNATLRSENEAVLLQHIRLKDPAIRLKWTVKQITDEIYLSLPDVAMITGFYEALRKHLSQQFIAINQNNGCITLKIDGSKIAEIAGSFNEAKIKQTYLAHDYYIQQVFQAIANLKQRAAKAKSFKIKPAESLKAEQIYMLEIISHEKDLLKSFTLFDSRILQAEMKGNIVTISIKVPDGDYKQLAATLALLQEKIEETLQQQQQTQGKKDLLLEEIAKHLKLEATIVYIPEAAIYQITFYSKNFTKLQLLANYLGQKAVEDEFTINMNDQDLDALIQKIQSNCIEALVEFNNTVAAYNEQALKMESVVDFPSKQCKLTFEHQGDLELMKLICSYFNDFEILDSQCVLIPFARLNKASEKLSSFDLAREAYEAEQEASKQALIQALAECSLEATQVSYNKQDASYLVTFDSLAAEQSERITIYFGQDLIDSKWVSIPVTDVAKTITKLKDERITEIQSWQAELAKLNPFYASLLLFASEIDFNNEQCSLSLQSHDSTLASLKQFFSECFKAFSKDEQGKVLLPFDELDQAHECLKDFRTALELIKEITSLKAYYEARAKASSTFFGGKIESDYFDMSDGSFASTSKFVKNNYIQLIREFSNPIEFLAELEKFKNRIQQRIKRIEKKGEKEKHDTEYSLLIKCEARIDSMISLFLKQNNQQLSEAIAAAPN